MKFETDNTCHGVKKITNGSYDVCKITVNNLQIENEISWHPRFKLWILKGRYEQHVHGMQSVRRGGAQVCKSQVLNFVNVRVSDRDFKHGLYVSIQDAELIT